MRSLLAEREAAWWDFGAAARWLARGSMPAPCRVAASARVRRQVALLMTDIIDSTGTAARLGDAQWADLLERHDALVCAAIARCGGELVDRAGDGVLAAFDDAGAALACAAEAHADVGALRLRLRMGVHVGGIELRDGRAMGLAVHVAARIAALAGPGETLASAAAREASGVAPWQFVDRGEHTLRGVPQPCRLFSCRAGGKDRPSQAVPALAAICD